MSEPTTEKNSIEEPQQQKKSITPKLIPLNRKDEANK